MLDRRRTLPLLVLPLAAALVLFGAAPSHAQLFPRPTTTTTTTTTAPPPTTTAPAPPSTQPPPPAQPEPAPAPEAPAPEAPAAEAPAPPAGGGGTSTFAGQQIPADAQRIIDSIERTPANNSQALYDAVMAHLVPLGLSEEEAIRIGFGRFPIAGVANYVHDWYYPRGQGTRFHEGTDVFATHGTPVRSPVEGTATSGNGALGGLWVKVHQSDGSYFYLAHLSGFVEGFSEGMPVQTGDIVGYVGDTGNARGGAPHVHLGLYTAPGQPTDPKPVLDQMLAEAMEALPGIVEQVRADAPAAPAPEAAEPAARVPRSLLASSLLRPLVDDRISSGLDAAALLEAVGNPSSGGLAVAQAQAHRLASDIDWEVRAERQRGRGSVLEHTGRLLRSALSAPGS